MFPWREERWCWKVQPGLRTVLRADTTCAQRVLTQAFTFHTLVTCTFLSAVTPRQYFLTRFLMQIFCSISDVYIKKKKKKRKSSEVVQSCAHNSCFRPNKCLPGASWFYHLVTTRLSSPQPRAPPSTELCCQRRANAQQQLKDAEHPVAESLLESLKAANPICHPRTRLRHHTRSAPLASLFTLPSI